MKKQLLLSLSAIWLSTAIAFASHISGGEVSYKSLGANQYKVSLVLYWDCQGINLGLTQQMSTTNACSLTNQNFTVNLDTTYEVSQLCSSALSTCNGGSNPGMNKSIYSAVVTLPGTCSNWTFVHTDCCRNTANNLATVGSFSYYATMNSASAPNNNSPYFTSLPFPVLMVGMPVCYNPWVREDDGNTLSYSFVDAMDADAVTPAAYAGTFTGAAPLTGISINATSGEISFTPTNVGNYAVSILVTEKDANNTVIGTVIRDIVLTVAVGSNQSVTCSSGVISNLTGTGAVLSNSNTINICGTAAISFQLMFTDPDISNILAVTSNIQSALPGATVTIAGSNPVTMSVSWSAPPSFAGTSNDIWVHVTDNQCPFPGLNTWHYTINVGAVNTSNISFTMVPDSMNTLNYTAFNGTAIAGATYSWDFGDGSGLSSAFAPSHTYAAGTYTPCLTVTAGGCASTLCNTITVNATGNSCLALFNIASDTSSANPNGYTVTNLSYGASLSYLWDFGDTSTSTQALPSHTYLAAGPYQLCLTVSNGTGCTSTYCDSLFNADSISHLPLHPIVINVVDGHNNGTTVGISTPANADDNISFYPNPSNGNITVISSTAKLKVVKVVDLLGESVYQATVNQLNNVTIDLTNLAEGIYLLKIETENNIVVNRQMVLTK